jgi:hypothetical protein
MTTTSKNTKKVKEGMSLKELVSRSAMSENQLRKRYILTGKLPRVGRGYYDRAIGEQIIADTQYKKNTVGPTTTRMSPEKLQRCIEFGLIVPYPDGRLPRQQVEMCRSKRIQKMSDGSLKLSPLEEPVSKDPEYMTYHEVVKALNLTSENPRGKIKKLLKDGKITLAKPNHYVRESVETYLNGGVNPRNRRTYTSQETKEKMGVSQATPLTPYVKNGCFSRVGHSAYDADEVDAYVLRKKARRANMNAKVPALETPIDAEAETYTAKEVKQLIGIDNKTGLTYYVQHGLIEPHGFGLYTKASVDRYIDARNHRSHMKKAPVPASAKPATMSYKEVSKELGGMTRDEIRKLVKKGELDYVGYNKYSTASVDKVKSKLA